MLPLRIFILIVIIAGFAVSSIQSQNLWAIDTESEKQFLIPKNNYQTYFRFHSDKLPNLSTEDSLFFRGNRYSFENGYFGGLFTFDSADHDSISLKLQVYSSFSNFRHASEYKFSTTDINEIQLQRSYNKNLENIWVYGGYLGSISLISSPFLYFNDHKVAGSALFSFGVISIATSFASYKLFHGFKEFKKPRYKFELR